MHVNNSPNVAYFRFCAVQAVINRQKVRFRKLIGPLDQHSLAALCFQSWARDRGAYGPLHGRLHVAVYLALHLPHRHAVVRSLLLSIARNWANTGWQRDFGNWKSIKEWGQGVRIQNRTGHGHLPVPRHLRHGKQCQAHPSRFQECSACSKGATYVVSGHRPIRCLDK